MRLFVGLSVPPDIRAHVGLLMGGVQGARWQRDDQLHITLRFIGEVDTPRAQDIDSALAVLKAPAFALRLSGVDIFGDVAHPRLLWTGVQSDGAIEHLRDKVEAALVRAGLPTETRKFKPHMTLARFGREKPRRLADYLAGYSDFATISFPVADFILYESRLGNDGAVYEPLARYPLEALSPA